MDVDSPSYPPAKRRRTSSPSSSRSRSHSPPARQQLNNMSTRGGEGDSMPSRSNSGSRSPSRDRDGAGDGARRTRRETSSPRSASEYGTPRSQSRYRSASNGDEEEEEEEEEEEVRSRSKSRSRSGSRARERARVDDGSDHSPARCARYTSRSTSPQPKKSSSLHQTQTQDHHAGQEKKKLDFVLLAELSKVHARGVTAAKFSPDGRLLATASADGSINVWTVPALPLASGNQPDLVGQDPEAEATSTSTSTTTNDFKLLRTLRAHRAGVNALTWSPLHIPGADYTLASASDDKSILLWQPLTSDFPVSPSPLLGHSNYVFSLAFSPKGNMLVSGSHDEAVFLWNVRSGSVMRKLPAHSDPVSGVDFVCDGSMMASASWDGLIRIWDSGTGQCLRTLVDEDRKGVVGVRFVPNGSGVIGWGIDGGVRLWRMLEGRCVKTYTGHASGKTDMNFGVGGCIGRYIRTTLNGGVEEKACVVSGSESGAVWIWDVVSKNVLWKSTPPHSHADVVLDVDWCRPSSGDGRGLLVSVGKDRNVKVWIESLGRDVLDKWKEKVRVDELGLGAGYAVEDEDEDEDEGDEDEMGVLEHDAHTNTHGHSIGHGHEQDTDVAMVDGVA